MKIPRRRALTLADLTKSESGPELTPYDLARISGGQFSDETIRREIDRGHIAGRVERRGRRQTIRWIPFLAAKEYFRRRGLIAGVECSTCHAAIAATTNQNNEHQL